MNKVKDKIILFFLFAGHLFILTNIQFTAWPEMLSYPYLLNKGFLLYRDVINPYTPLLSWILQLIFSSFQDDLLALKLVTYTIIVFSDVFLFLITKKIFTIKKSILILSTYILWQIILEGNGLWYDLAITPLSLLSFYLVINLFQKENQKQNFYFTLLGFLLSISFLIKQTTALFFIVSIIALFKHKFVSYKFVYLLISFATPIILTFVLFSVQTILPDYIFWVYIYPFNHLKSSGFLLLPTFKQFIILLMLLVPAFLAILKGKSNKFLVLVFVWFIASLSFSVPRFSYFHLQPAIPFAVMLTFLFINKLKGINKTTFLLLYIFLVVILFTYFSQKLWGKEVRFYDTNTQNIANSLKEKLYGKGPIFFYNVPSEFFVISGIVPPKPWADTFPWYLESKGLQERIVNSLKDDKVNYIVARSFKNEGKYIPGSYKPEIIDNYIGQNFTIVEKISDDIWIMQRKK